jgi:hypothetical protein
MVLIITIAVRPSNPTSHMCRSQKQRTIIMDMKQNIVYYFIVLKDTVRDMFIKSI